LQSNSNPPMFFWFGMMMLLILAGDAMLPTISGKLNPAVSQLEFIEIKEGPQPERNSDVRFAFEKLRDCAVIETQWYIGSEKNGVRVTAQSIGNNAPQDLDKGDKFESPFWRVQMPKEFIKNNSEIYFIFRCNPFFKHKVKVWDK